MIYKAQVAVVKDADIRRRTSEGLRLIGGIGKVVGKGDKVFLKPNVVDGAPLETGEVVQLEVIEVLVEESFKAGASEVIMGEVRTSKKETETMEKYGQMAERLGAKWLNLDLLPFAEVEVETPIFFDKVRLSKPFLDCDVFIDVPALKTHVQCGVTLAVKNMYGLIPKEDRRLYHQLHRVEEAILDLYQARKADLIVVDGTYTTYHIGPRPMEDFTETSRLDLTLAGFDPIAVDAVGAEILGIDASTLRYLKWGEGRGFGTGDMAEIEILGTPFEEARFGKAVGSVEFVNARMENFKVANFGACTGCVGFCVQLLRYGDMCSQERMLLVMGLEATGSKVRETMKGKERVILFGNCAAPTFYNNLQGDFIHGCPPAPDALSQKIEELITKSAGSKAVARIGKE